MYVVLLLVFGVVVGSSGVDDAQTTTAKPSSNLELRLQTQDLQHGVPQVFTFLLMNVSDHEVRVPIVPIVDCRNPLYGELWLQVGAPLGQGISRGCPVDPLRTQTILDRVQNWRVLRPGASMSWRAGKERGLYGDEAMGVYEFWAHYNPPVISPSDQAALRKAGIDFPTRHSTRLT